MISFKFEGKTYSAKTVKELQKILESVGYTKDVAVELDKINVNTVAQLESERDGIIEQQEQNDMTELDAEEQEAMDQIDGEELENFFDENKQDLS